MRSEHTANFEEKQEQRCCEIGFGRRNADAEMERAATETLTQCSFAFGTLSSNAVNIKTLGKMLQQKNQLQLLSYSFVE